MLGVKSVGQQRSMSRGEAWTYRVMLAFLDTPTHKAPHQRLETDDLCALQSIPERLVERDVARGYRRVRDAEDCTPVAGVSTSRSEKE